VCSSLSARFFFFFLAYISFRFCLFKDAYDGSITRPFILLGWLCLPMLVGLVYLKPPVAHPHVHPHPTEHAVTSDSSSSPSSASSPSSSSSSSSDEPKANTALTPANSTEAVGESHAHHIVRWTFREKCIIACGTVFLYPFVLFFYLCFSSSRSLTLFLSFFFLFLRFLYVGSEVAAGGFIYSYAVLRGFVSFHSRCSLSSVRSISLSPSRSLSLPCSMLDDLDASRLTSV
jgi:hypothetical protein